MIVCSCNVICHKKIEQMVELMFHSDPNVVLTPGKVYKAVGYRPKCATCLLHIGKLMHEHRESLQQAYDQAQSRPERNAQSDSKTDRPSEGQVTRITAPSSV